jgi:hypothetical protein
MIICDFNCFRAIGVCRPLEAKAPLLIDPDAVLALSIPSQGFEVVTGELRQVMQASGGFQYSQALFSLEAEALERSDAFAGGEAPRARVSVAPKQEPMYLTNT